MKTCYKNARIVLPDAVREGCLMTENDTISAIAFGPGACPVSYTHLNGKKPFQVMINPTLAEKYGQDFEKVAVVRELENFRRKNSLKSLVGLLLPVEVLAAAVPAAVAFGPQLEAVLGSFVLYFAAPFAARCV